MDLGVCYYPEHWPEARWATDAATMKELGLSRVRVGEFAWSRLEPARGDFRFDWLRRAIDTLGEAGLGVIMCTPTATPPKWLVNERPDILPTGEDGRVRGFGSRRHYSHSSSAYREESQRITRAVVEAFGDHPAVVGWQTDNEYGCHDTVEDYGPEAARAFRDWLEVKYGTVDALNAAWGNVFWSMEYGSFGDVDLPRGAVTELNPAHRLDFQRFSSDQVVAFDAEQVAIIRAGSPGRFVCHNTMGVSLDFDHHDLGEQQDMLAWDSYPLGFLEQSAASDLHKQNHATAGDPDFQAFHHDLYRGAAPHWGVMEQQNGPVNWAPVNPAPAQGMVRLWTLEAWAHGASLVSYFRWRQCPFAQEQNHSGLLRVDGALSPGGREVEGLAAEIASLPPRDTAPKAAALVFSYPAEWVSRIQPQGAGWSYWQLVQTFYRALREAGLNIDVVAPGADLSPYKMVVVPSLPIAKPDHFRSVTAPILFGPRTGSKTDSFTIPDTLPPGDMAELLPLRVTRWQTFREGMRIGVDDLSGSEPAMLSVTHWLEDVELTGPAEALARTFVDDAPVWVKSGHRHYLGAWPTDEFADRIIARLADEAGLTRIPLRNGLRIRKIGGGRALAVNYGPTATQAFGTWLHAAGGAAVVEDLDPGTIEYDALAPDMSPAKQG